MATGWQRKRNPDEVPTPVAVAVSDFCRRAGAQASAGEVREALALLSEDEDFRVRSLTDSEPNASPLGPFAVVDVLRGTDEALAATRQTSGYYEVVRELVQVRAQREPPAPAPVSGWSSAPTMASTGAVEPRGQAAGDKRDERAPRAQPLSVAERIAPKRRSAAELARFDDEDEDRELPALEPARAFGEARPKGRFSTLSPSRQSVDELFRIDAKEMLSARIAQHPDRFALTRALGEQYGGKKEGQVLRTEDVERALEHHDLMETLAAKEREAILGALTEQRGATGKAAFALGLTVSELMKVVRAAGIGREVEEIRERFRREALSPKRLAQRLDLLGRGKYLSDLGIRRKFDEALRADLKKLLDRHRDRADSFGRTIEIAARDEGTEPELLRRALEKLGLT